MPETRGVLCQNKFGKLVHLVGFIIKKFVTMHGLLTYVIRHHSGVADFFESSSL